MENRNQVHPQQSKMQWNSRQLMDFQEVIKKEERKNGFITEVWELTNEELTLAQHVVKWYFVIAILKFTLEVFLYTIQIIVLLIPIFKLISRCILSSFLDFGQAKLKIMTQNLTQGSVCNRLWLKKKMIVLLLVLSMIQLSSAYTIARHTNSTHIEEVYPTKTVVMNDGVNRLGLKVKNKAIVDAISKRQLIKTDSPISIKYYTLNDAYWFEIGDMVNFSLTSISIKMLKICTISKTTYESNCTNYDQIHTRDTQNCYDLFTETSIRQGDIKTQTQFIENKKERLRNLFGMRALNKNTLELIEIFFQC